MTSTPSTSLLIPQESRKPIIDDMILGLFLAHNVAIGNARILVLQPPFRNELLTTLPEDQALAGKHAHDFLSGWGHGVTAAHISGLTSISEFMLSLLNRGLLSEAKKIDSLPQSGQAYAQALSNFRALISAVIATCCDVNANSHSTLLRMKTIMENLRRLTSDIDNDDTRLQTALKTVRDNDTVAKLAAKQRNLQNQLAEVNHEIAKGATTMILSDIMFGFKFGKEFLSGITTGAVVGAAMDIVGEVEAVQKFDKATAELRKKQNKIGAEIVGLVNTIARDKTDMMNLTLTAAQIGIFNTQSQNIVDRAAEIIDQMTDWTEHLELLSDYQVPPHENFFTDQVTDAIKYWTELNKNLRRYAGIMAHSGLEEVVTPGT